MRDTLQRAVSCVTADVLTVQADNIEFKLNVSSRLPRVGGGEPLTLSLRHAFTVMHNASSDTRSAWQARTSGYLYTLEGSDGREVLAYHWHPAGRSHATTAHLHLGAGAGTLRPELMKAHLVTGHVTPVALLTLLLEHFAVRPRRADWPAVLERARRALEAL